MQVKPVDQPDSPGGFGFVFQYFIIHKYLVAFAFLLNFPPVVTGPIYKLMEGIREKYSMERYGQKAKSGKDAHLSFAFLRADIKYSCNK